MPYTAQHIMSGASGLPEDRFVNTFHFQWDGIGDEPDSATVADIITERMREFYTVVHTTHGALTAHLPLELGPNAQVRVYDSRDEEPRPPQVREYPLNGRAAGTALPTEVAVCLSFYSGRNLPRQRGRVYIGPLKANASTQVAGGHPFVIPTFRAMLAALATRLSGRGDGLIWSTLSKATPGVWEYSAVTAGWVDDAFDTQRRRGIDATTRNLWTAAPA